MDLNELFFRHQIALMRGSRTADEGERRRLRAQADCFAGRIGTLQRSLGAGAPLAPPLTTAPAL
jgi:hypothetical protein